MKNLLLIAIAFTTFSTAFADVCGIVTREQAEKSLSFLTKGAKLTATYSDLAKLTVQSVSVVKSTIMDGVTYYDLKVNGVSIDPGHTNIIINRNVSLNLGRLVGCDVESSDPDLIIRTSLK